MSDTGPTDSLALLADLVTHPPQALFQPVARTAAGMALTDLIGVALAGIPEEVSVIATSFATRMVTSTGARIVGSDVLVAPQEAAFTNATIGHALDFDDSSFILGGHPSVVIFPALLPLAEDRGLPPKDVISAYLVGFEALLRIARAVNFQLYEKGWHPTATLGVFGAAAGAARLIGLDHARSAHALGLAAAMAGGFKASFGTMAKPLQVGHACRSGVTAALLAEAGATASAGALDAANGFFALFNGAGNYDASALARPSGDDIPALKFKLYPSCGATHVVIDAARALRTAYSIDADQIERIEIAINPRRLPHVDRQVVNTALEGKFSLQFTAAVAFADGNVGVEHFSAAALARTDIAALITRIEATALDGTFEGLAQPCAMRVTLKSGVAHDIRLDGPQGREPEEYPANMQGKFLACAKRVLPDAEARALYDLTRHFETLDQVGALTERMTITGASAGTQKWKDTAYV